MKLLDLYAKMKGELNAIERQLEAAVAEDESLLGESSLHLLQAGGKRIRPVFVLLAGRFGDYRLDELQRVAVTLELIHSASLVHDDVIDNARTRRGQPTVGAKWDNRIAMYTGDYIYAKALELMTQSRNPDLHRILARAMVQMCIGEMEQVRDFFNTEQSVRNYLRRIRRKTALLIAISCQMGAVASGADRQTSNLLYQFGYNTGMAFQIRDDLLDLLGTEKQIGKPPGSDIRQGNITLPVLLALQEPDRRDALLAEIGSIRESEGRGDTHTAIHLIRSSRGVAVAEEMAERFTSKALAALAGLPALPAKKNLSDIAHFINKRSY
ncbi:polyprenyl synthetase family protein [Paenibacillus pasadenensis]|uniref:polyprenyl synthetase family protein n=1 Tax=Paenibacillus pasadenensis TaxID=217090 RepID=UPI002041C8A7|nr:polyprenyl synthetase family protein [Paenibacillus pasadenensis]MCM3747406.1 polyprenyl synthetase family protein [Paenibacillus pasadenensis]